MLLQTRVQAPSYLYPTLEGHLEELKTGKSFLLPSCCFHDFWLSTDQELAGMGLAILGNVCKLMKEAERAGRQFVPSLWLRRGLGVEPEPAPWPGMLSDAPLPLNPDDLPFDVAMFFDAHTDLKRRVDRLALMRRIEVVWVSWVKSKMVAG